MKRFIMLTLIFFGFLLSYQTLKIISQQRYMANINVNQFKDKTIKITSPDIFAEKNVIDTFKGRYKASIKFNLVKDDIDFSSIKTDDLDLIIYPSFFSEYVKKTALALDDKKIPNLDKLMDIHSNIMKGKYIKNGSLFAIPVAYIPYAIFFDPEKIKPSTSAKDYLTKNRKIAIPDNYESLLALSKFLSINFDTDLLKSLFTKINKEDIIIYNISDLESVLKLFEQKKPEVIIAPVYLKGFFERRGGTIEMIIPDEGTYATYYLISLVNEREKELSFVFINHILDPLIQKNYTTSFTIPITNKVSLNTIPAVLYNSLRMNDFDFFKKIYLIKDESELKKVIKIYQDFKSGF